VEEEVEDNVAARITGQQHVTLSVTGPQKSSKTIAPEVEEEVEDNVAARNTVSHWAAARNTMSHWAAARKTVSHWATKVK